MSQEDCSLRFAYIYVLYFLSGSSNVSVYKGSLILLDLIIVVLDLVKCANYTVLDRCSLLHRPVWQCAQTSILPYCKSIVLSFPNIVLKHRVKCYHFAFFSERCMRDRSNNYKPVLIFVCWKAEISELCNSKLSRILCSCLYLLK